MIHLHGTVAALTGWPVEKDQSVFRLSSNPSRPAGLRPKEMYVYRGGPLPEGFLGYVASAEHVPTDGWPAGAFAIELPQQLAHLDDQDVVAISSASKKLRVLFRNRSPHNSFLVTERCNHYCLMCSQPPRNVDDEWLVAEIIDAIRLVNSNTHEIGLTGGEPTLLGSRFLDIIKAAKVFLPRTSLHILSNGRRFENRSFAQEYAEIGHPDAMVGIPIYSDISQIHDYVVQAEGAFDETIRGILNLRANRQKIEIRVVVHQQTYARLPELAEFIARNLRFVDHVALMGLEMTGFTKANISDLWIDPLDYQGQLGEAVSILAANGMNVSVYNHQLCLTPQDVWPFMRKSISDWKNEYMPECEGCAAKQDCGGFFSSAIFRYSDNIRPFEALPSAR